MPPVQPSLLRCEKGMESYDSNNMKTFQGRKLTDAHVLSVWCGKKGFWSKKWRPPDEKNVIIFGQQHSRWLVFKGEETVQDPKSDGNDGRYQPQSPGAAEKNGKIIFQRCKKCKLLVFVTETVTVPLGFCDVAIAYVGSSIWRVIMFN